MDAAVNASVIGPHRLHAASPLGIARVALGVAALAALYRILVAFMPPHNEMRFDLLRTYGILALTAFVLQWGIQRGAPIARWAAVLAGEVLAVALVAGRHELATVWHHLADPHVDISVSLVKLSLLLGFIVAAICCVVARSDAAGPR